MSPSFATGLRQDHSSLDSRSVLDGGSAWPLTSPSWVVVSCPDCLETVRPALFLHGIHGFRLLIQRLASRPHLSGANLLTGGISGFLRVLQVGRSNTNSVLHRVQ